MLLEQTENQSVDDQPAVSPEQAEEALHLIERDDLSEEAHYPVLAEYHNIDVTVFKVLHQVWELFFHKGLDDFDMVVETRQLTHVHFLEMIVIQCPNRHFKG